MVDDPHLIWEEVMKWGITDLKGRSLNASLCKLAFGAVVYQLWKRRNDLKHGNMVNSEDQILKRID